MKPRITGTEMEWAVVVQQGKNEDFIQPEAATAQRIINARHPSLYMSDAGHMLSNGGRLYVDVGSHPEYATPEDTSFMGTVANEIAGEAIMYDAMDEAKASGLFYDFILNKRVVDDELNTWGYHASFCCDALRIQINRKSLAPLGPHLATHNIYAGAGSVIRTLDGRARYVLAQKVLNLNADFAQSSHGPDQPLVSLRKESLADKMRFSRVHITSMDANMSPWATWMKLGTTSVVLRMMELGYLKDDIRFEDDMHQVAMDVAYDTDLKQSYRQEDGRTITALDVQYELLLTAQKMASREGLPDEEMHILDEWEHALTDLDAEPELLIDRADWVAKRAVLRRYMARHALDLSDGQVMKKDRQWSHIGPLGIASRLRDGIWSNYTPVEEADRAYLEPPSGTRAATRGRFIKEHQLKNRGGRMFASWEKVQILGSTTHIVMDDPSSLSYAVEVTDTSDDGEYDYDYDTL